MKVRLDELYGVILDKDGIALYGIASWNAVPEEYGVIRWDTPEAVDIEDWRGLFGSFLAAGGSVVKSNYEFKFITDKGGIKAA